MERYFSLDLLACLHLFSSPFRCSYCLRHFSFSRLCSVDGILLIWLETLKLRLEEVWELLKKGMLFSIFKVRNGKDGLVVEVNGIVFGCIMVFARGTWMCGRQGKNDESIFCVWVIP